jgi:hypothetical protein
MRAVAPLITLHLNQLPLHLYQTIHNLDAKGFIKIMIVTKPHLGR